MKQIPLRLSQELFQSIKAIADSKNLSINQFIVSTLSEAVSDTEDVTDSCSLSETDSSKETGKMITYRFPKSYATLIHQKASQHGLTDTAYLRQMIRSRDFKRIEYSLDDLWEYIAQSQQLIDAVVRFVELIDTAGKGQVYEPDIRRILSLLEEIKSLHKEQIRLTHDNRESVYKKMIQKIEDAV